MQKNGKYVRLIYGILLSVMTVILGALLIGFTFEIYNGGSDGLSVFSREKVGKQLASASSNRHLDSNGCRRLRSVGGFSRAEKEIKARHALHALQIKKAYAAHRRGRPAKFPQRS